MRLVVFLLAAASADCCGRAAAAAAARPAGKRAAIVRLEGMITPFTPSYLERKLETARRDGAELVIIEIDSPGGELFSSMRLAQMLGTVDWAETVAYIPGGAHGALSGAAFAALGCERIFMGPTGAIGDAGVIESDGESAFRYVPEKERTHVVRTIRDLAAARGRPAALAEAMVDKDLDVFKVRNKRTGVETYMSEKELAAAEDGDDWEKGKPVEESLGGNFLEVNGARAVELGLADGNADSREDLCEQLGVAGQPRVLQWTAVDTVVLVLNWPIVTGLLFIIGLVALYFEMSSPGLGMGILIAGLCFALFFWSRFLGGTADWLEIVLFLAGLGFLALELFVLPGFGIAGLSGMLLLGASLILASQDFVIPHTGQQLATLLSTLSVLTASLLIFFLLATLMSRYFGSMPILSRLMLQPPAAATEPESRAADEPALGDLGVADSALRPAGRARFGHRMLDVMTDGEFIDRGCRVQIVRISGRRVFVAPARGDGASAAGP
ncbi:MAG: NfeD family protein [Planctomycetota bacterium]|jgi:membrane-bound serine protease (ClpP class)|nr:NfeD family protein [Planctomycetota bacterium]